MPLGIIIWLVLIIIIATLANPGSWIIDLTLMAIAIVFISIWGLLAHFLGKRNQKRTEESNAEREQAIDEWEKKWGRKHPTRISK